MFPHSSRLATNDSSMHVYREQKKDDFIRVDQNYLVPAFDITFDQNQWPKVRSTMAFYAFMASEAFFSCTGLG